MKCLKLTIVVSVIILISVLYLNYNYHKIEKFESAVLTGPDALKTVILNGYSITIPPDVTLVNDILCNNTNPDKIRCLNKVDISHPLTPHDLTATM